MKKLSVAQLHIGDKVYFDEIKEITNTYIVLVNISEDKNGKYGKACKPSGIIGHDKVDRSFHKGGGTQYRKAVRSLYVRQIV